jgi:hypothetical protein
MHTLDLTSLEPKTFSTECIYTFIYGLVDNCITEQIGIVVTVCACILEVLSSNLGHDTVLTGFSLVFFTPSKQMSR